MMLAAASWRALPCGLGLSCGFALGCSSPDLGSVLFSCTTAGDCPSGQVCVPYQGGRVCQLPLVPPCADGGCEVAPAPGNSGVQSAAPDTGGVAQGSCKESGCGSAGISLAPRPRPTMSLGRDAGIADAGAPALTSPPRAAPDAAPPPAQDAPGGSGSVGPAAPGPVLRRDFELTRDGWRSVPDQRPEDTLDGTERTTALAHHGSAALRMVFDGNYTPVPGVTAESNAFYGAYEDGAPPPGAQVSLWVLSTAPNVRVELYAMADPPAGKMSLATVPLMPQQWRQISVTMPTVPGRQLGLQVHSALNLRGFVYLDEIRW